MGYQPLAQSAYFRQVLRAPVVLLEMRDGTTASTYHIKRDAMTTADDTVTGA